ncbi:gas vesicle protein [Streptomyces roseolus]|uniref:gas vesicle protein n=1 Tax=Streptomyces roseolus TaxID=67358 RepID=UPI0033F2E935
MNTPRVADGRRERGERLTESPIESPLDSPLGPPVALIDLLDRLLTGGAVLTGDLVLSIADVDLVHINLRAVIRSVTAEDPTPWTRVDGPERREEDTA